jgi:hypothetical protein
MWSGINITGLNDLEFSGLFAAAVGPEGMLEFSLTIQMFFPYCNPGFWCLCFVVFVIRSELYGQVGLCSRGLSD